MSNPTYQEAKRKLAEALSEFDQFIQSEHPDWKEDFDDDDQYDIRMHLDLLEELIR